MDYVRLGRTGLKVSRLCLGCMSYGNGTAQQWALPEAEAFPFYKQALDAGINFFDTADIYSRGSSEEFTGRALLKLTKRHQLVIATKLYGPMGRDPNNMGLSRKHIFDAIDRSLQRLGTDYVDLYQIHRFDYETPIEETLEALNDVVRAGKARYIGASSMYAWQFALMLAASERHGWAKFVSMQPQYSLLYREEEREMLPLCLNQGVGVIPWSPLGRGLLSRPRAATDAAPTKRAETDRGGALRASEADNAVIDAVTQVAEQRGVTNSQIALAWHLAKPAVTAPIVGATKPNHLAEAVDALTITLTPEEVSALEAPYVSKMPTDLSWRTPAAPASRQT